MLLRPENAADKRLSRALLVFEILEKLLPTVVTIFGRFAASDRNSLLESYYEIRRLTPLPGDRANRRFLHLRFDFLPAFSSDCELISRHVFTIYVAAPKKNNSNPFGMFRATFSLDTWLLRKPART